MIKGVHYQHAKLSKDYCQLEFFISLVIPKQKAPAGYAMPKTHWTKRREAEKVSFRRPCYPICQYTPAANRSGAAAPAPRAAAIISAYPLVNVSNQVGN